VIRPTCGRWCRWTAGGSRRAISTTYTPRHHRNNRLQKLSCTGAEVILRNEKRMLQERWTRCSTTAALKAIAGAASALEVAVRHAQGKQGGSVRTCSASAWTIPPS